MKIKLQHVLMLVALLALPFFTQEDRFLGFILGVTLLSVFWATGMNILYGFVGLMPLMFAAISGIAAYALLYFIAQWHIDFWQALPLATLFASLIGVLLGLPSIRLKGFYFTLCSLIIQSTITLAFIFFPTFTNGDTGINQISPPLWMGEPIKGFIFECILSVLAVTGIVLAYFIYNSQLGQRFIAIREDDVLAESLGISVFLNRVIAFFIVSLYAAIGGCFYATYIGFISPRSFDVLSSLNIWLFVAFGGKATIAGPVIGALLLAPLPFLLQSLDAYKDILSGVLIVLITLLMPGGIYGAYLAWRNSKK
ncbi:MAG: branched-chain amino acid ABC transporter permease [Betaproteobacteria bacterium]|jgi:branched-chain amino acid transport system permease protein